uniref:Uncharacterized protein n=1 Tax=Manihot esculenta TaxID=3983 RepID=A0A2C9VXA1_MANES
MVRSKHKFPFPPTYLSIHWIFSLSDRWLRCRPHNSSTHLGGAPLVEN